MAMVLKMGPADGGLEYALGRRNHAFAAGVEFNGHAQGAAECLEDRLALVMRVLALQVVDMKCRLRVVDEALEEFARQIDVELADMRTGVGNVVEQPGAAREVDDDTRERFVERHIGVTIAAHT